MAKGRRDNELSDRNTKNKRNTLALAHIDATCRCRAHASGLKQRFVGGDAAIGCAEHIVLGDGCMAGSSSSCQAMAGIGRRNELLCSGWTESKCIKADAPESPGAIGGDRSTKRIAAPLTLMTPTFSTAGAEGLQESVVLENNGAYLCWQ